MSYLFFLLKISNRMCYYVLIQTVDDVINSKVYLRSTSKVLPDRGKIGEDGNTKI